MDLHDRRRIPLAHQHFGLRRVKTHGQVERLFRRLSIIHSETAKCPPGGYREDKNRNRRPQQQNGYHKEIARSSEPAVKAVQDQIYDPGHYPAGRNEKPDPKQSATPIDGLFVLFRANRMARNAKVLHEVGVTSQREIERIVREGKVEGDKLKLRVNSYGRERATQSYCRSDHRPQLT